MRADELAALAADADKENRRARESIRGLIRQLLSDDHPVVDDDFGDAEAR